MSEHTPFNSPPPLYTQSGDDTNSSITGGGGVDGEKRNGIGAGSTHEFRQNHTHTRAPQPHELTAEWTVRAQLTFARAGEKVQREFSSNDPLNPVRVVYKWSTLDATATAFDNNEHDLIDDDLETTSTLRRTTSSHCSGQSTPLKRATPATPTKHHQSFHSTSSSMNAPTTPDVGVDSAFSGSRSSRPTTLSSSYKEHSTSGPNGTGLAAAAFYGTRCRSTCNIVVSAVADFLPPPNSAGSNELTKEAFLPTTRVTTASDFVAEMEPDPFVYNTTASDTVLPQQSLDDNSTTASISKKFKVFGKALDLRDAFCQTSDTETKYFEEYKTRQDSRRQQAAAQHLPQQRQPSYQQHRQYDQRRLTAEGLLQPSSVLTPQSSRDDNESNVFMHSNKPSPSNTFKSSSMSRIPQMLKQQQQQHTSSTKAGSSTTEPQKKPRTVHIDVYCTGSEDDEQADAEASTSSSDDDDSKRHEVDSTSTRQTVLDNEQMRLRHQRMSGPTMPRRLAHPQQQQQQRQQNLSTQSDLNLGHGVTKSSTAEEVSESKQLLFRKHIGDQRAAKLATLRQKYLRQPSDDALSSTYPNSSRSTVRDATCSSISSAVLSSHAGNNDVVDSSWKETEEADDYHSLGKSDSFEYANSVDRLRIRQMEKLWSRDDDIKQAFNPTPQHGVACSPLKPSHLQTISEGNSQPSSPYRPTAPVPFFQRNDTINSDLENFSENDVFIGYPNADKADSPLATYRRQFSQPLPQLSKTPSPSPPKVLKPTPLFLQQTSHFPRNRPGFLQFFGPGNQTSPLTVPESDPSSPVQPPLSAPVGHTLSPNYQPNLERWKSEGRDNLSSSITPATATSEQSQHTSPQLSTSPYTASPPRAGSEAPPTTTSAATFPYQTNVPIIARRFDLHRDSPTVSETSTVLSGYTPEYLEKARKFGKVVTMRKPGHHVGPTKNPNCSCESCQRWLAERFQLRSRAFSLGERPVLKRPTKF